MYRELITAQTGDATFFEPAAQPTLDAAAESLGIALPTSLTNALRESNGIHGEYELGLLWSIDRIVDDNLAFRNNEDFRDLYMPFDCLLFFADAGNGDQFAYVINNGVVRRPDIFAWNHEDDSRVMVAPNLDRYFEWWLNGTITL